MNTARPIISTPEAEASSATAASVASAAKSSESAHKADHRHTSNSGETSTRSHLGQVVASQAQEQAIKLTHEARRQATVNLEQQTRRAGRIVGALGIALHQAGSQLRAEDEKMAASYYDMAGDRVDHLAGAIERQDAEQLISTVQRFAQRQPILFIGATVVIGALGVRAIAGSSRHQLRPASALHGGAH